MDSLKYSGLTETSMPKKMQPNKITCQAPFRGIGRPVGEWIRETEIK